MTSLATTITIYGDDDAVTVYPYISITVTFQLAAVQLLD